MHAILAVLVSFMSLGTAGKNIQQLPPEDKIDQMASLVAGKPVDARCYTDSTEWATVQAEYNFTYGDQLYGFAFSPSEEIWLGPKVCQYLMLGIPNGGALMILAHEAAHARGVSDEAWANCWGRAWVADLARRYYGIRFFTKAWRKLEREAAAMSATNPPEYRAYGC
jgi:hypothetical protein